MSLCVGGGGGGGGEGGGGVCVRACGFSVGRNAVSWPQAITLKGNNQFNTNPYVK